MSPLNPGFVREEVVQRREEGCDPAALAEIDRALESDALQETLARFYDALDALEPDPDLAAREPSDFATIRRLRPDGPRRMALDLSAEDLEDRMLGAWLARAAGCELGKPVEGWPRADIRAILDHADEWPLRRYFPPVGDDWNGRRYHASMSGCLHGNIRRMERDDDTDYTILGLVIAEDCGPHFTTRDLANCWLLYMAYRKVYTAETIAYRNLVLGLEPPATATWRNPYREWIGAQIRADAWGYVAPGIPEVAAELAFRDAALTHTRNGIYGEMWMAASIAAAFSTGDPAEAIRIGLTEIPAECRLSRAIRDVLAWHAADPDPERITDRIGEKYGGYHPVHTINNAALVALGVLDGAGDLGRTIGTAVAGGWDTDCNGASAGSILGAAIGARPLPYAWVGPLNDTIDTALSGVSGDGPLRFTDLARRTHARSMGVREAF